MVVVTEVVVVVVLLEDDADSAAAAVPVVAWLLWNVQYNSPFLRGSAAFTSRALVTPQRVPLDVFPLHCTAPFDTAPDDEEAGAWAPWNAQYFPPERKGSAAATSVTLVTPH